MRLAGGRRRTAPHTPLPPPGQRFFFPWPAGVCRGRTRGMKKGRHGWEKGKAASQGESSWSDFARRGQS